MKIFLLSLLLISLHMGPEHPDQSKSFFSNVKLPVTTISPDDLFGQDSVLNITLNGNIKELTDDRAEVPSYHPIVLTYSENGAAEVSIPIEAKTRGHFRKVKGTCQYPPLLLNFSKKDAIENTVFKNQTQLKLVVPCRGEEFVVHEWLVYKLYNLITPKSFRGRIVHVVLNDTQKKKQAGTFYGLLLEDETALAKRNNDVLVKTKMVRPEKTEPDAFLNMAVFEYMIANTDWSVQYLQNIKLLAADSLSVPATVPYDFDLAGIVDAPYALPAEELQMSSVRERRYRGYCITDMSRFNQTIALFNKLKKDFYDVYQNCTLIDDKYRKATFKYLDAFYQVINDPKQVKSEFGYPCDPNGTGNVIIQGLAKE